jgi:hypothetical protein
MSASEDSKHGILTTATRCLSRRQLQLNKHARILFLLASVLIWRTFGGTRGEQALNKHFAHDTAIFGLARRRLVSPSPPVLSHRIGGGGKTIYDIIEIRLRVI